MKRYWLSINLNGYTMDFSSTDPSNCLDDANKFIKVLMNEDSMWVASTNCILRFGMLEYSHDAR